MMGKAGTYKDIEEYNQERLALFAPPMGEIQQCKWWTTDYKSTYWVADTLRVNRLKRLYKDLFNNANIDSNLIKRESIYPIKENM